LRKEYRQYVPEGYCSNTKLGNVLAKGGLASLDQLLKKKWL
jgi:hypothetical protein